MCGARRWSTLGQGRGTARKREGKSKRSERERASAKVHKTPRNGATVRRGHLSGYSYGRSAFAALFLIYDAILHYEPDAREHGDILQRIAGNCDHIGVEAGLELADCVLLAEQTCTIQQAGAEHIGGGHSVLHHQLKLARLRTVREWPDIGAYRHRNACR